MSAVSPLWLMATATVRPKEGSLTASIRADVEGVLDEKGLLTVEVKAPEGVADGALSLQATVMGPEEWVFVPERHGIPAAVAGFTAASLLAASVLVLGGVAFALLRGPR